MDLYTFISIHLDTYPHHNRIENMKLLLFFIQNILFPCNEKDVEENSIWTEKQTKFWKKIY